MTFALPLSIFTVLSASSERFPGGSSRRRRSTVAALPGLPAGHRAAGHAGIRDRLSSHVRRLLEQRFVLASLADLDVSRPDGSGGHLRRSPGSSQFTVPYGDIAAAAMVVTVPVLILVLVFQRRIVSGLTAGAVKG